jgi:hypothetical protein
MGGLRAFPKESRSDGLGHESKGGLYVIMNQRDSKKRYGLFVLAVGMLLLGSVILVISFNDLMIRSLGFLMCVVSVYLVRASNSRCLTVGRSTSSQSLCLAARKHPVRLEWAWGMASAAALGTSLIYLYMDALDGYNQIFTVYTFAGNTLICTLVWSYLISRLWSKER